MTTNDEAIRTAMATLERCQRVIRHVLVNGKLTGTMTSHATTATHEINFALEQLAAIIKPVVVEKDENIALWGRKEDLEAIDSARVPYVKPKEIVNASYYAETSKRENEFNQRIKK